MWLDWPVRKRVQLFPENFSGQKENPIHELVDLKTQAHLPEGLHLNKIPSSEFCSWHPSAPYKAAPLGDSVRHRTLGPQPVSHPRSLPGLSPAQSFPVCSHTTGCPCTPAACPAPAASTPPADGPRLGPVSATSEADVHLRTLGPPALAPRGPDPARASDFSSAKFWQRSQQVFRASSRPLDCAPLSEGPFF